MTIEAATQIDHGAYIDHYGYCFCNDCAGRCKGDATWYSHGSIDMPTCDGCQRPLTHCTPRTWQGTAVVEHIVAKIF